MPVVFYKEDKGKTIRFFAQWGDQKRYYFDPKSKTSIMNAYKKAVKQGQAISISKRMK